MVTVPTLPNLDGLIGLARQDGVDVRPTLVRVLTDLYVQKRDHTPDEVTKPGGGANRGADRRMLARGMELLPHLARRWHR